jgi:hypothetical protein
MKWVQLTEVKMFYFKGVLALLLMLISIGFLGCQERISDNGVYFYNAPNPFSVTTTFRAVGPGIESVKVYVWDHFGRLIFESFEIPGDSIIFNISYGDLPNGTYRYLMLAKQTMQVGNTRIEKVIMSNVLKFIILR